jgi:DNA-binding CsgD family transcriptional regulator
MEPELLGSLLKGVSLEPGRPAVARLTDRERTVKNVLHDVVTKLNARSRSQAIAFAVREGLI